MKMEKTSNNYVVKWEGSCFLCSNTCLLSEYSLQYLSRYLKMDTEKMLHGPLMCTRHSFNKMQHPHLNVELCDGCAHLVETFSKQFRRLEKLQMEMTSSLSLIQDKLLGKKSACAFSQSTAEGEEGMKLKSVETFRLEAIQKCSSKLRDSKPRIKIQKLILKGDCMNDDMLGVNSEYLGLERSTSQDIGSTISTLLELDMEVGQVKVEEPSQTSIAMTTNEDKDCHLNEDGGDIDMEGEQSQEATPLQPACSPVKKVPEPIIDKVSGKPKCFLCLKGFEDKSAYQTHYSSKHLQSLNKCKDCGQKFKELEYLKRHQQAVHRNPTRFQCKECPKTFASPGYLNQHMKTTHLGQQFCCAFCSKSFSSCWNKDRHMRLGCPLRKRQGNKL